jgi:hypothetical protein
MIKHSCVAFLWTLVVYILNSMYIFHCGFIKWNEWMSLAMGRIRWLSHVVWCESLRRRQCWPRPMTVLMSCNVSADHIVTLIMPFMYIRIWGYVCFTSCTWNTFISNHKESIPHETKNSFLCVPFVDCRFHTGFDDG